MTQFWAYKDAFGTSGTFEVAFDPDVIRLGEQQGVTEVAEHLQVGSSTLVFDDPDADLGNAGDAILGIARIKCRETAAPVGSQRLYTGIIGTRTYRRGRYITGASREIEIELHDLNAMMSLRVIPNSDTDAIRPAETVDDRMTWLMSTNYMNGVVDDGFIVANSTSMTANDYRGQAPANVVNDCELAAGFGWNAFVYYWDETATNPGLFFDNANTSTAFSSTLQISNVLTDLDDFTSSTAVTFGPSVDASLSRDPTNLGSGVYLPYSGGAVYVTDAGTIDAYGKKDIVAPNSNVSTSARATAAANDFLFQHATEEDRITCTVELPPSKVNLIRAGMRIQVKFSHLPGYEFFTWCRVLSRTVAQTKPTDDRYWMRLELSPQELPCVAEVTYYPLTGTITASNSGAGTQAPGNPTDANDGNVLTYANFHAGGDGTADEKLRWITLDHGSAITLSKFVLLCDQGVAVPDDWPNRLATATTPSPPNEYTRFRYSTDNSVYTDIAVTLTARDGNTPELQTYSFDNGEITARYWRILMGGKGGYGGDENIWHGGTVFEWDGVASDC